MSALMKDIPEWESPPESEDEEVADVGNGDGANSSNRAQEHGFPPPQNDKEALLQRQNSSKYW